jgi:hypothetical protein
MHQLFDPWAPHKVVNQHLCFGGGGSDQFTQQTPNVPDYTQFISAMSSIGNQGSSWARDLYSWAQSTGVNLSSIANTVSAAAGKAADTAGGWAQDAMGQWKQLSTPLYAAQQADALRMIGNLPQTEEEYAGKYGADTAMALDQQKASAIRAMEGRGISPNAASTGALDTMASANRALATTAASEGGRQAARTEARGVTGQALTSEQTLPTVAGQQQGIQTQNLGLQTTAPNAAATASSGLYSPAMGMYSAAYPYMNAWGSTMANSYNQQLAGYNSSLNAFKANQEAQAQGSGLEALGGGLMGIAGSYAGSKSGSAAITSGLGSLFSSGPAAAGMQGLSAGALLVNTGGRVPQYAEGGINTVPPEASPSRGRRTDDVNAMLSAGEFVIPKRTVDWHGEKFFQNLIAKTDKEIGNQTVAQGEEKPVPAAIATQPPMFRSEGART